MGYVIITFFTSLLLSVAATPLVRWLATRHGFVDHGSDRKHQRQPVALGGGVAVFAALWLTCVGIFMLMHFRGWQLLSRSSIWVLVGLFVAGSITAVAGLLDDRFNLRARYKLGAQLLAALIVIASGVLIGQFTIMGMTIELGLLAVPFTVLWLVGAINAMNLIDGSDGVASSVGMILCLSVALMAWLQGSPNDALVMTALAGALAGFLAYNFPPASIYLGDTGSMLIGLIVGTMAISSSVKGAASVVIAIPVAIWAIPFLDSGAAILRRQLTGRSLFCTDRGHLHHSLLQRGFTPRGTLIVISVLAVISSGSAVLSVHFGNEWIALSTLVIVLVALCSLRIFGHVELELVGKTFHRAASKGWTKSGGTNERKTVASQVRLRGTHEWDCVWASLVESAERFDLTSIKLTIDLPAMEEAYFASWHCEVPGPAERSWSLSMPLMLHEMSVGRLTLKGLTPNDGTLHAVSSVVDFLEPIEEQMEILSSSLEARRNGQGSARQLVDSNH